MGLLLGEEVTSVVKTHTEWGINIAVTKPAHLLDEKRVACVTLSLSITAVTTRTYNGYAL